jgi:pyridine nucleotide-disulfide oxidoreductase family protein
MGGQIPCLAPCLRASTGHAHRTSHGRAVVKRVLLVGAGHAQLSVLVALARLRLPGAEVLLVSTGERLIYSGMLPGLIAGRYAIDDCAIDIAPLAAAAGAQFLPGRATALDADAQVVTLADGQRIEYDLLCLNTGPVQDRDRIPGARDNALFVRPIEAFVHLWPRTLALAADNALDVVVVGGGAAGVEIALAVKTAIGEHCSLTLVSDGPVLPRYDPAVRQHALAALARRGVQVLPGRCTTVEPEHVLLGTMRVACDVPIMATGSNAPSWLAGSGLALDEAGFVRVGATLQSASHANVFAAGDLIVRDDAPHPRSGVYAVRAGPVLAENLRRWAGGGTLTAYKPQRRSLNLLALGDGRAIASRGSWSMQGRVMGWWKDRIDREFIARYRDLGQARK